MYATVIVVVVDDENDYYYYYCWLLFAVGHKRSAWHRHTKQQIANEFDGSFKVKLLTVKMVVVRIKKKLHLHLPNPFDGKYNDDSRESIQNALTKTATSL